MSELAEGRTEAIINASLHKRGTFEALQQAGFKAFAGLDVAKVRHPAHLCLLVPQRLKGEGRRRLVQVGSIWFERTNYSAQIEYVKRFHRRVLPVEWMLFDNTRSELEGLVELGIMPEFAEGVTLSLPEKWRIAGQVNIALEQGRLALLPDERQRKSLLQVDNLLRAEESGEVGHGDALWSLALAVDAADIFTQDQEEFTGWEFAEGREPPFPTEDIDRGEEEAAFDEPPVDPWAGGVRLEDLLKGF